MLQLNPWIAFGGVAGVMAFCWLIWWLATIKQRKARKPIVADAQSKKTEKKQDKKGGEPEYPAIIINPDNVWDFGGTVNKIMGAVFVPDGTLPQAGKGHYLVIDKGEGANPWDPRDETMKAELTPEKLYRAVFRWIHCLPYRNPPSLWEKLPALIAYLLIGITFLHLLLSVGGQK